MTGASGVCVARRPNWPRRLSTVCAVVGAACLWAWGYVANLSASPFPDAAVRQSIGIEFAYYASQATLLLCGLVLVGVTRRWHPALPPGAVVAAAAVLSLASLAVARVLRLPDAPRAVLVACGVLYGVCGMLLSVAWGARYSLGSRAMRRMVLLSFLVGYGIYFAARAMPHAASTVLAVVLPLMSGGLWLFDSWRRHLVTDEVWPKDGAAQASGRDSGRACGFATAAAAPSFGSDGTAVRSLGEASEGSTALSILPWRSIGLFAVASLLGNFIASFLMGSTYTGADVLFPAGFAVAFCLALVATMLVGRGEQGLSIERLYRYVLPVAVLGMLLVMVAPSSALPVAGALVMGASMFLQALIVLKVTEVTQETGVSPLLSFAVGQGVVGGVVFAGNIGGRLASSIVGGGSTWLEAVCAAGVFALFYLLTLAANDLARRLVRTGCSAGGLAGLDGAPSAAGSVETTPLVSGAAVGAEAPPDPADLYAPERVAAFAERFALTPRETDVLAPLLRGRSLANIAERLYVTAGTVKTHTLHIYRKTGVGGRQELMDLFERGPDEDAGRDG